MIIQKFVRDWTQQDSEMVWMRPKLIKNVHQAMDINAETPLRGRENRAKYDYVIIEHSLTVKIISPTSGDQALPKQPKQ